MLKAIALALMLLVATKVAAQTAHAIDGDTLEVAGERIRLWGIDAVEGDQMCQRDGLPWKCGDDATKALQTLLDQAQPTCTKVDVDRYGRIVAKCTVGGQDIGAAMVRSGWALDYERYSDGAYLGEQINAVLAQRGLWSGSFVPPWEWRQKGQ